MNGWQGNRRADGWAVSETMSARWYIVSPKGEIVLDQDNLCEPVFETAEQARQAVDERWPLPAHHPACDLDEDCSCS